MQKVYGLIGDGGDASLSISWFKDKSIVLSLLENDDAFYVSLKAETLVFPDDFDLISAGFHFSDDDYADN